MGAAAHAGLCAAAGACRARSRRWWGQLAFGLRFDNGLVALVIGAAGVSILLSLFLYPPAKRLSDTEASLTFLFDIAQLSCLLYLTGGITNPFALLVMAPVAVAAMALRPRSTLLLSLVAIALITLVSVAYRPCALPTARCWM